MRVHSLPLGWTRTQISLPGQTEGALGTDSRPGFYLRKQNPWTGLSLTRVNDKSLDPNMNGDSLASTLKILQREFHEFPESAISSHLLILIAHRKEPHVKGTSQGQVTQQPGQRRLHPRPIQISPHSRRAGCWKWGEGLPGGRATYSPQHELQHGEGEREEEENRFRASQ